MASFEDELVEAVRSAVRHQRQAELDEARFESDLRAALEAEARALEATMDVTRGNTLEDMLRRALRATKMHEDAKARLKALGQAVGDASKAVEGNERALRDAMAQALAAGVPDIEDEHHVAVSSRGRPKLRITDPSRLDYRYLQTVPNDAMIRSDLMDGKAVDGAELDYGESGVTIKSKSKTRGKKERA